jgi:transposase-like protein
LGRIRAPKIRKVIYCTNAIESMHARFRRAVRVRGRFLKEQAALKCLYLTIRSLDPYRRGSTLEPPLEGRPERIRGYVRRMNRDQRLTN